MRRGLARIRVPALSSPRSFDELSRTECALATRTQRSTNATNLMRRILLPLLTGLTLLAACGGDAPSDEAGAAAAPRDSAPVAADAKPTATDFEPIDPKMGGLSLAAEGPHPGEWTFKDVNGSVQEIAGGGTTQTMLQLEAHSEPVHFKMRLITADGELRPGRYGIGDAERRLDATYENAGVYYTASGAKAKGTVELTSISDDRAAGRFDLTLETLSETPASSKVSGTFDMIVQR